MKAILKRYTNREVSEATGLSEGLITAYASKKGKSTKSGWTIPEIIEVVEAPRSRKPKHCANQENVTMIRNALIAYGLNPNDFPWNRGGEFEL